MATSTRDVRPTGDLGLLLPDDWWVVPLTDRKAMRRSLLALADRQFGRADNPSPLKHRSRVALEEVAATAAAAGGRILAVCLSTVHGVPLTITLATYRREPVSRVLGHEKLERMATRLRTGDDAEVLLGEGPAGPVLREVTTRRGPDDLGAAEIEQLVVRYVVDVPAGAGPEERFEAVFSSPHPELREGLLDLFDALVASVGFVPADGDATPEEAP